MIVRHWITRPGEVRDLIVAEGIRTLIVAGDRASTAPEDFGDRLEKFLGRVFRQMGFSPGG